VEEQLLTSIIRSKINTLFIISSILYLNGCGGDEQSQGQFNRSRGSFAGSQTGSLPVKVDTVKSETISTFILTNTTLEAQRTVNVITRVSGIVKNYYFEEGSVVKKGDLLIKLDDRELKLKHFWGSLKPTTASPSTAPHTLLLSFPTLSIPILCSPSLAHSLRIFTLINSTSVCSII